MRKTLIVSVSAIALLAASQQAFARDEFLTKSQAVVTKPNVVMPNRINKPGDGAMNVFTNTKSNGGLPGGGSVPNAGSLGIKDPGLGRPGVPSGSLGSAKDQVGNIKGSVGRVQGRQTSEGATVQQTEAMKKALGASPGCQVVGVNPKDGDSKLSSEQRKALKDAVVNPGVNHDNKDKDKETAKHLFDFAKPKELKPIVFPNDKIIVPKPPKH